MTRPSLLEGTTKGPWKVRGPFDLGDYEVEGRGEMIARRLNKANARLIAAAPDLAKENEELRADSALLGAATFLIEQAVLDPTLPGFLGEAITHLMRVYALHPDHPDPERATAILEREG